MSNWIELSNFGIAVSGLTISLLGLILAVTIRYMEQWNRRFFIALFALLVAYIGSDLLAQISMLSWGFGSAPLSQTATFFESLFSSMAMPMLTRYLLHCTGVDRWRSWLYGSVLALWGIYCVLLVVTQFTTGIYYFTPDNVYHRGAYYPLLLVPPALLMAVNIIALYRRRSRLTRRQRTALMIYCVVPLVTMLVQMAAYGLYAIVLGTAIAGLCMFLFVLIEQLEQHVRTLEENERQKASITVLQMRPHFIYNTMTSIYYLCQQDPKKAQQVTLDFTSYLRKIFTAVAGEAAIPFPEELEHTRAYLAVEQVRFEGLLFVEWDTPCTAFRIPPLTLQPIVENAVKHGLALEDTPLHVSICTREDKDAYRVIVEDTGPGFSPADNDEPHIALSNLRTRLDMIGGSLDIAQREGGGTRVTVKVPR